MTIAPWWGASALNDTDSLQIHNLEIWEFQRDEVVEVGECIS